MCGIVGFFGKKNKKLLVQMLEAIEHRGRDERAIYVDQQTHMGMNRLAIVDMRRGLYPVRYKQYVLLYNGEIYNHLDLRNALKRRNIALPDGLDAYVILPLYDLYGAAAFSMLEGMFALSIYDTKRQVLILARDKSGEKPLYYIQTDDVFAFSSEMKALLPFVDRPKIRPHSLAQYMSKGYIYGHETLVKRIKKVLASEYLIYNKRYRVAKRDTYWNPPFVVSKSEKTNYRQHLRVLLERSVHARMLADVPVGCFISGGIDSALIAYFASQYSPNLRTYSVSFPGYARNDESLFARYAAKMLGTHHTEVLCTAESIRPFLDNLGSYIDEPVSDPAILPTLLLSKEARKSVKVVLTGEGADELFGGYTRYVRQMVIEYVRNRMTIFGPALLLARATAPHRFQQVYQTLEQRYCTQRIWTQAERRKLFTGQDAHDRQIYFPRVSDFLLRMQLSDYRGYLSEQLFMKADKSTMAYNLESRAPYVDTDIINFALNLSDSQKVKWLQGKYLLKQVASKYFPWWFVWRPKHGFSVPLRDWLSGELSEYARMSVEYINEYAPALHTKYYASIVDDHIARRADHADKIWNMLILGAWLQRRNITI